MYSYCDTPNASTIAHDQFLQCTSLRDEKNDWIAKSREALVKQFTPPNLRDEIIDRVYNYYKINLRESMLKESIIDN